MAVRPIGVEISHNEIGVGAGDGIRVLLGTSINVHDNHVYNRFGNGIILGSRTSNATLQANHLFANTLNGIEVRSSSSNTLLSNQSEDNAHDGIAVRFDLGREHSSGEPRRQQPPIRLQRRLCRAR